MESDSKCPQCRRECYWELELYPEGHIVYVNEVEI